MENNAPHGKKISLARPSDIQHQTKSDELLPFENK
jgi:hypothetical protein